ncbi:hypothetical protein EYF80_011384 [Liparis tanakae]|uniref:Uncharacterized protein n=1 Tax=Liparis tanakae TaxID=230148 RepID=A0A4Z2IK67_9TELE|nr:hypothetical protein EYF80_011384 [Liparis tanakae]
MRSSSCCSCLSHSPGSEPDPSILRSVRRSNGDKESTAKGTGDSGAPENPEWDLDWVEPRPNP